MTAPIVVLSQRLGAIGQHERRLEAANATVRTAPLWTLDEIARQVDARIFILGAVEPFDAAALSALPNCDAVIRRGVGVDNIDVNEATRLGIVVANVPDASIEEVSDHALSLLLALERRIVTLDSAVRAGSWERDTSRIADVRAGIRRLTELTLGIVGFGRIGQALARKARPIYGRMLVADPAAGSELVESAGATLVEFSQVIRDADHISLHVPLLPSTRHLFDEPTLRALRRGAILVNTSRGGVIDERAVSRLLSGEHHLGGLGLDVTEREPTAHDDPLLALAGVVLTAHSAASSTRASLELARRSVDAAMDLLNDRRPASIINPEVLGAPSLRAAGLRTAPGQPVD